MSNKSSVAIIDYGSGNLKSVYNAIATLNICKKITITDNIDEIAQASHIILPGVGAFADCMEGLKSRSGVIEQITKQAIEQKKPLLGICVGMQILADSGQENGFNLGLGFIAGEVQPIAESENFDKSYKIPQIGWNNLEFKKKHAILEGVDENCDVYFANSYRFVAKDEKSVIASVNYGCEIGAIIAKENILGIQFHPEKSGEIGLKFLRNFILT